MKTPEQYQPSDKKIEETEKMMTEKNEKMKRPDNAVGEPEEFPGGIKRWQLQGDDPTLSPEKYMYVSPDGKTIYLDHCMTMTRGFKWAIDDELYLESFYAAEKYILDALKK